MQSRDSGFRRPRHGRDRERVLIFASNLGTGISGTLRYMLTEGKDAETGKRRQLEPGEISRARPLGGQNFGFDPRTPHQIDVARRVMEQNGRPEFQGDKDNYATKDSLHISLSWARGQTPDEAEKTEAAREFLKALGMENAQALFVEHTDKSYAHIHIVASRIDPETGMAYDDYQRLYKGLHRAIEWEREKNQVTPQRQWCHDLADATRGDVDHERLKELLFANEATVKRSKLNLAMAFGGHFGPYLDANREAFVKHHDLIRLKQYQEGKVHAYTTSEIWKEEAQTLANARKLKELAGFGIDQETLNRHAKELSLTDQQKKALWDITRDNGLALLSGQAGSGKSHELKAFRKASQWNGDQVIGLAKTNKVVESLQADGFDSRTIDSEMMRVLGSYKRGQQSHWTSKTRLVVDEAAQLSTEELNNLLFHARKSGAKVVLCGDGEQLGSVDQGGLFPIMENRFGSAKLTEIMRTKHEDQKRAFNKMHEKKWAEAVKLFEQSGSFRWNQTRPESLKALAEEYAKDFLESPEAERLIVANKNDDVKELNEFVRNLRREQKLKETGKTDPETEIETAKGKRLFSVGDRIALNESAADPKERRKGLINGAFGYVRGIETGEDGKHKITVELDRKKDEQRRTFKLTIGDDRKKGEISGIDHGYASTVYKAQGRTLRDTYVMHDPASARPTNYVAMSRHKERVKLYVSKEDTASAEALTEQLKHGDRKTAAHAYQVHEEDRPKLEHKPEQNVSRETLAKDQKQEQHEQKSDGERKQNSNHEPPPPKEPEKFRAPKATPKEPKRELDPLSYLKDWKQAAQGAIGAVQEALRDVNIFREGDDGAKQMQQKKKDLGLELER